MKCSLDISNFLKKSVVFPILFFSFISLHWWLRKALALLAIFWNSAFKWVYFSISHLPLAWLLFLAMCRSSSDNNFAFLHLFFIRMVLITASCTMSQTSDHRSLGALSDLIPCIYLSLPLFSIWFRSYLNGLVVFPYFLQFKSEFANKEFMIWATFSSQSVFTDCIELLHIWLKRI